MTFNDWEIDAIRRALNNYRTAWSNKGRQLSWKKVIENILSSTVTTYDFPDTGNEPEFLEEALRRFGNGTSMLQPAKIEDLKKFLLHEGFLRPDESKIDPSDFSGMLAFLSYLSNDSTDAREKLSSLTEEYVVRIEKHETVERVALSPRLDRCGSFFRIEERSERYVNTAMHEAAWYKRDGNKQYTHLRKGYGFVSTNLDLIHIFVRGAAPDDRVTYVQAQSVGPTLFPFSIPLMRCGAPLRNEDFIDNHETPIGYNIYNFSSL